MKMINKWFWICLIVAVVGIALLFVIGYLMNGTLINLNGWRFK